MYYLGVAIRAQRRLAGACRSVPSPPYPSPAPLLPSLSLYPLPGWHSPTMPQRAERGQAGPGGLLTGHFQVRDRHSGGQAGPAVGSAGRGGGAGGRSGVRAVRQLSSTAGGSSRLSLAGYYSTSLIALQVLSF